jgi:prevent-host-death family protein
MGVREPAIQTLEITDVEGRLSHLVDEVSRNELRVIVAEAGAPIAAVVSVGDLERWARLDREREERFTVLDRMRAAFADIPPEEIEREVAKAVAEVRAEMVAEREEPSGAK